MLNFGKVYRKGYRDGKQDKKFRLPSNELKYRDAYQKGYSDGIKDK